MKKSWYKIPIYPFLFASLPILKAWRECNGYFLPEQFLFALLWQTIILLGLFIVLLLALKSSQKAALITLSAVAAFYLYIPFEVGTQPLFGNLDQVIIAMIFLFLCSLTAWLSARKVSSSNLAIWLNLYTLLVTAINFAIIMDKEAKISEQVRITLASINQKSEPVQLKISKDPPDIYYIIVDAFANPLTMKSMYGYDESNLLDFLKKHGFIVCLHSNSNYDRTETSVSSSLNMRYLDDIPLLTRKQDSQTEIFYKLIQQIYSGPEHARKDV